MQFQITLSPDLKEKLEHEAQARGMSLADFVRESLEKAVVWKSTDDPLFSDRAVYRGDVPTDVAANHDDYLYGEDE